MSVEDKGVAVRLIEIHVIYDFYRNNVLLYLEYRARNLFWTNIKACTLGRSIIACNLSTASFSACKATKLRSELIISCSIASTSINCSVLCSNTQLSIRCVTVEEIWGFVFNLLTNTCIKFTNKYEELTVKH